MILTQNKSVFFHYEVLETFTAGLVLHGWEVKSLKSRNANVRSAWVKLKNEELFTENFEIRPYKFANGEMDAFRAKKLLLKKSEIRKIEKYLQEKGRSLSITKIFAEKGKIKAEIIVGKGKKKHEKRETEKKRTVERNLRKQFGRI